tara:strand:- start:51 stop:362 length:312 start_codon:yes stop_codon:yes gene_type:complete
MCNQFFSIKFLLTVINNYFSITIKMAVNKSKKAKKNSIITFILLFLTKFLIADPKAAHGEIDIGQIKSAILEIKRIDFIKSPSLGKNPDAAILEIVQALGFTI